MIITVRGQSDVLNVLILLDTVLFDVVKFH